MRQENELKVELDSKIQEIDRLKDVVLALQRPLEKTMESDIPAASPSIPASQIQILKLLEQRRGVGPQQLVLADSGESRVKTEYDLGELERAKLIEKDYDNDYSDFVYRFTHEGRRVLLEHEDDDIPY